MAVPGRLERIAYNVSVRTIHTRFMVHYSLALCETAGLPLGKAIRLFLKGADPREVNYMAMLTYDEKILGRS